ncbi:MAG: universal stress protein [Megasphaera sp.]|jgi:nucleotide-binding universal stress UspA family protein|nr:universal stress protein [Megasphaera sp.]MCI1822973.1 universal stress protein [Megasphaera sp.]
MKKYQNIIVLINEEINTKQVLEHAIIMANAFETIITLVYVVNIALVISKFYQSANIEQIELGIEKQGEKILKEISTIVPQGIKVKGVIEIGSIGSIILSAAKKYNADFIVIDKQIFGLPKKNCINSFNRYKIAHSDCTILIVQSE